VDGQWIGAIDRDARHRVGFRLDGQRLPVRGVRILLLGGRHDVVAVVLHDKDHRQLPQRSNIQRLMEGTLLRRAVAKVAEDDFALLADLRVPGRTCGVRDAGADNA
jgi:hypothetical protein